MSIDINCPKCGHCTLIPMPDMDDKENYFKCWYSDHNENGEEINLCGTIIKVPVDAWVVK